MFPNDDICNIRAARNAAKRIFQRYTTSQQQNSNSLIKKSNKSSNLLGQLQVQSLMKNAYNAININFTPSSEDISSFMEVFGIDKNQKQISLDKMEQLAVKYLCGQDSLISMNGQKKIKNYVKNQQNIQKDSRKDQNISCQKDNLNKINNPETLDFNRVSGNFNDNYNKSIKKSQEKPQKLDIKTQLKMIDKIQSNNNSYNNLNNSQSLKQIKYKSPQRSQQFHQNHHYLSPKSRIQPKKFTFSSFTHSQSLSASTSSSLPLKQSPFHLPSQFLSECYSLYSSILVHNNTTQYPNTLFLYKQLLIQSYKLINYNKYNKYNPTDDDIKIWMKLCDVQKNGNILYTNYQNFMIKLYQREKNMQQIVRK